MRHKVYRGRNKGGRPTLYEPQFCDVVERLGLIGKSVTETALALGVTRRTYYYWLDQHDEFLHARARTFAQAYYEDLVQRVVLGDCEIDARVLKFILMNHFPEDYRKRSERGVTRNCRRRI